jgi:glycosyltransferase involved in cell wall biosynthesis
MAVNVAHIVTRCIAGAGGVAVRGAISIDPQRYRGTLVTGSGGPLLDEARSHGVDVVVIPELVSPISPRQDAIALARIIRVLRERHVDVVHTHSAKAGVLGRLAARRVQATRVVHTMHGFPFHEFQPPLTRATYIQIERRMSRLTDAFLAIGTGVAVEMIRLGIARPDQIRTIGPAVETPTVTTSPATRARARLLLGIRDDVLVVGTVGRMDYQKAPEVLIEAVSRLTSRAMLVWAGDGPLFEAARQQVAALGLQDRILLLGNRTDVPTILPAFDVFAMASRYEGLPCVIVEAQQCGIPVVATAVNAVPDVVIPGETGLLVPAGRADLLAGALDHALANPHLARQWVLNARTHLGARYAPETLGMVLDEVYSPKEAPAQSLRQWPDAGSRSEAS